MVKQPPLIDTTHLAETDPEVTALDQAHVYKTQRAIAAKREWFLERVTLGRELEAGCALRLAQITNDEDGFIHEVQILPNGGYLIVWWRFIHD